MPRRSDHGDALSSAPERRAFFITALPGEFSAVREHLVDLKEHVHSLGTVYETGIFVADSVLWRVAVVQAGPGNVSAAVEVERGIQTFDPEVVLMVGVAGGLKDLEIGDVVASSKVYGFEVGKETEGGFQPRAGFGEPAYDLVQRAQSVARNDSWQHRSLAATGGKRPKALVGPIASGEKIIASTHSTTYVLVRQQYSDALAVEMEGFGVLRAVSPHLSVRGLIIRGISDLIDHKAEADGTGTQLLASKNAAAFAFQVLAELTPLKAQQAKHAPSHGRSEQMTPKMWGVPRLSRPGFLGRDCELKEIGKLLRAGQRPVVVGVPGVGKTQLVAEYIYASGAEYDLVLWFNAENSTTIEADYTTFSQSLGLWNSDGAPLPHRIERSRIWLEGQSHTLVVFSGASAESDIAAFLPRVGSVHSIITSLSPEWSNVGTVVHLDSLPVQVAAAILSKTSGTAEGTEAEHLALELGGLPLAIEQASAYIRQTKCSLTDYSDLLESHTREVLNFGSQTFPATIAPIWDRLRAESGTATRALWFASFLSREPIPLEPFKEMISAGDRLKADLAVASLRQYSLAEIAADGLCVHPLTSLAIRAFAHHNTVSQALSDCVLGFAACMPKSDSAQWPRTLPHALSLIQRCHEYGLYPPGHRTLLYEVGVHKLVVGDPVGARSLLFNALQATINEYGEQDLHVAECEHSIGATFADVGDMAGALPHFSKALSIARKALGSASVPASRFARSVGTALATLGKRLEATAMVEEACRVTGMLLGTQHPDYAIQLIALVPLIARSDPARAIRLATDGVRILQQAYGIEHRMVGEAEYVLGLAYAAASRVPVISGIDAGLYERYRARGHARRALRILKVCLGDNHPRVKQVRESIGGYDT